MSWEIQIGWVEDPITVYDGASVRVAVTAALVAVNGDTVKSAEKKALEAWRAVSGGNQAVWETVLCDDSESPLIVRDSSPVPQYDKRCDGYDSNGDRCGRYMNHPKEC